MSLLMITRWNLGGAGRDELSVGHSWCWCGGAKMLIYLSMNEENHCATFVAPHMDAFAKYSYNFSGKTM